MRGDDKWESGVCMLGKDAGAFARLPARGRGQKNGAQVLFPCICRAFAMQPQGPD